MKTSVRRYTRLQPLIIEHTYPHPLKHNRPDTVTMRAATGLLALPTTLLNLSVNANPLSITPFAKRDLNQCGWCNYLIVEGTSTCESYSGRFNGQNICSSCGGTCGDGAAAADNEDEGCPVGSGAASSSC